MGGATAREKKGREHAAGGWVGAKAANNGRLLSDTGYQFFSPNLEPARCLAHRLLSPSGIASLHGDGAEVAQSAASQSAALRCLEKEN